MARKCHVEAGYPREKPFTSRQLRSSTHAEGCRSSCLTGAQISVREDGSRPKWATQTALARRTREELGNPLAGPMGALGISNEITADFGKERRTTTRAPPAETLRAVANSSESLPLASRDRTKTGMARPKRTDFLASLAGTRFLTITILCLNALGLAPRGPNTECPL